MENYENKELLKDAAKKSLESLKDLKPGTEEYNTAANMALKLYDMQLKDEAQENEKQLKEDEAVRKVHELELDQEKAEKARKLDWAKIGMKALTFAGTIGMTVYWSICEAGGVTQLSRAIGEGVHARLRRALYVTEFRCGEYPNPELERLRAEYRVDRWSVKRFIYAAARRMMNNFD